ISACPDQTFASTDTTSTVKSFATVALLDRGHAAAGAGTVEAKSSCSPSGHHRGTGQVVPRHIRTAAGRGDPTYADDPNPAPIPSVTEPGGPIVDSIQCGRCPRAR